MGNNCCSNETDASYMTGNRPPIDGNAVIRTNRIEREGLQDVSPLGII